jgi:hypothetical protein
MFSFSQKLHRSGKKMFEKAATKKDDRNHPNSLQPGKNIIFTYRAKGDQLAFLLLLLHRAQGARLASRPAW